MSDDLSYGIRHLEQGLANKIQPGQPGPSVESDDSPWVVYYCDSQLIVKAIFANEIDALRFALSENACDKVKQMPWGVIG